MTNSGTAVSGDVLVKLNGNSSAIFQLNGATTQVFNAGDVSITQLAFQPQATGFTGPANIEIIYSVMSVCNS